MRVTSLIALVAVVLGALYFIFLTPQWAKDIFLKTTGYGPAATPTEAVDKFTKAVRSRDFKTAALFCTGDYAEQLKRGAPAAAEMSPLIDSIAEYMKNKGLASDKCVLLLHTLDPFPANFTTAAAPKEVDATNARGLVKWENPGFPGTVATNYGEYVNLMNSLVSDLKAMDPKMFSTVLRPVNLFDPRGFDIVKEGESWKLKFVIPPGQVQAIDFYVNNYKAYHTGLTRFRRDVTNERFASKQDFERDLVKTLQESK